MAGDAGELGRNSDEGELEWLRGILAADVRAALDGDEPALVFQPIVDLHSRSVVGVEALSRFGASPHRTPDVWFAAAHRAGLGVELEHRAVARAAHAAGSLPEGVSMAINASPQAIRAPGFASLLAAAPADRIVIEITEHARVDDYDELLQSLLAVRALGVRIAVDDVGAGFATLRHVLRLDPEIIKLDREITVGVESDPGRAKLIGGLIAGAAAVSTLVVAEGIESEQQLLRLLELGVRGGQGWFIGRPTTLDEALACPISSLTALSPQPSPAAPLDRPRTSLAGAAIVVVEDAVAHRRLLRTTFEAEGASVTEAPTLASARALLRGARPDVVLVDVRLPDGSGFDLLAELRQRAQPPIVVFVTAASAVADRIHAFDGDVDDYVLKPFVPADLVARVDRLLRRAQSA